MPARAGSKVAYRDAHGSVTYAALLERTGNLAGHLADLGIAPGETVAILLPNSVPWVETCLAIARAGAVSVPISSTRPSRRSPIGCPMPTAGRSSRPASAATWSRGCAPERRILRP